MNQLLDKQVYAGLMEVLKDSNCYYPSPIGSEYDMLTERGEKAVVEFIKIMAPHMIKNYKQELDQRAKRMVIQELQS
jgi:hypothetical protein